MERTIESNGFEQFVFLLGCVSAFLWILLYAIDKSPVLFKIGYFSYSVSGIFGMLAAAFMGWYWSKTKIYSGKPFIVHLKFSLLLACYALTGYFIGLSIYTLGHQWLP
jgi:vacuolar-type H+-ATPase subunit I/STV1